VVVPGEDAEVRGSNFGGSPEVSLRKGGRELTALTVNQSTATEIGVSVPDQVPGLTFDDLGLAEATRRVATGVPPAADRGITVSREVPQ
jgi:F0F1-type ATP synthase alpha subunit